MIINNSNRYKIRGTFAMCERKCQSSKVWLLMIKCTNLLHTVKMATQVTRVDGATVKIGNVVIM